MADKRNINLNIADIPLNLNIAEKDEEVIRRAAKEINERVSTYKTGKRAGTLLFFSFCILAIHH